MEDNISMSHYNTTSISIAIIFTHPLNDNFSFFSLVAKVKDVFGHLDEELANKLTFDGDTRMLIAEALKVERVGVSNYTKILKEKGILNEDKKSFNKKYHIPNLKEFIIRFE